MHVIHIVESFATGTREMVRLLANRQVQVGLQVTVWHGRVAATPVDALEGFDRRIKGVELTPLGDRSVIGLFLSSYKLLRLRKQSEAVVHIHSSIAGILCRLFKYRALKLVYTPHGFSLARTDLGLIQRVSIQYLERFLDYWRPSTIVACSTSEAKLISHNLPRARVSIIANATETEICALSKQTFSTPLRIVAVGRISTQKNFNDLIYLKKHSRCALDIRVIGDGDSEAVALLKAQGIAVSGWLTSQQVSKELHRADLFLQCSLWEGMPISVLEAMAAGLPVVARDAVGTRDLVRHLKTGLVYYELSQLLELVEEVEVGRHNWPSMLEAAQAMLEVQLSPELMCNSYQRLYESK